MLRSVLADLGLAGRVLQLVRGQHLVNEVVPRARYPSASPSVYFRGDKCRDFVGVIHVLGGLSATICGNRPLTQRSCPPEAARSRAAKSPGGPEAARRQSKRSTATTWSTGALHRLVRRQVVAPLRVLRQRPGLIDVPPTSLLQGQSQIPAETDAPAGPSSRPHPDESVHDPRSEMRHADPSDDSYVLSPSSPDARTTCYPAV